jgi:hypothetical protein
MSNREADTIAHDLQGMRSTSDFTRVASQIRDMQQHDPAHLQRNLDQINNSVDMRALGFPSDFRIAGVNDGGQLVTVSADGRTVEQRNTHTMRVESSTQAAPSTERMGSRDVTNNQLDGSRTYALRQGDTLWSVARDSLQQPNGERPTNSQINDQVARIARDNNIADPNRVPIGTELRISSAVDTQRQQDQLRQEQQLRQRNDRPGGPYAPTVSPDLPEIAPRNGSNNPLGVPGLAGDSSRDPAVSTRETGLTERLDNGNTVTNFSGKLNDGWVRDTRYTAQQTTDATGRLMHSVVNYDTNMVSSGADLTIRTPTGDQSIRQVRQVETNFNARTGRYDTTFRTNDGSRYQAVTARDGRVVAFTQTQGPSDQ